MAEDHVKVQMTFWATEWVSNVAAKKFGEWAAGGGAAIYATEAVDAAVVRAHHRLVGQYGFCEVEQISLCPLPMGDSVSLLVTVLARTR